VTVQFDSQVPIIFKRF